MNKIPLMDKEHQEILNQFKVMEMLKLDQPESFKQEGERLLNLMLAHNIHEEYLMLLDNYPALRQHRKDHNILMNYIARLIDAAPMLSEIVVEKQIHKSMMAFKNHVNTSDKTFYTAIHSEEL